MTKLSSPATVSPYGQRAAQQRWRQHPAETGTLTLGVEALAKYRDDPIRLRMVRDMLARNFSGDDDTPLGPEALAAWHDQNRRAHELVTVRLVELGGSAD